MVRGRDGRRLGLISSPGALLMMLIWLISIPLVAGIVAALSARYSRELPRWISLIALGLDLVLAGQLWLSAVSSGPWLAEVDWAWVPSFGIHFHLAMDGLSLLMLLLTFLLGMIAVLA